MKKFPQAFVLITLVSLVGCVRVQYDNHYFRQSKPGLYKVDGALISASIFSDSPDAGPFNNKQQGSYFLNIKVKTKNKNDMPVIQNVIVQSREGTELKKNKQIELKATNYHGEGMWWTKTIEEGFQPKFYDQQLLSVSVTVRVNGVDYVLEKEFSPKHSKAEETVNILTM